MNIITFNKGTLLSVSGTRSAVFPRSFLNGPLKPGDEISVTLVQKFRDGGETVSRTVQKAEPARRGEIRVTFAPGQERSFLNFRYPSDTYALALRDHTRRTLKVKVPKDFYFRRPEPGDTFIFRGETEGEQFATRILSVEHKDEWIYISVEATK